MSDAPSRSNTSRQNEEAEKRFHDLVLPPEYDAAAGYALIEFVTRTWNTKASQGPTQDPETEEKEVKELELTEEEKARTGFAPLFRTNANIPAKFLALCEQYGSSGVRQMWTCGTCRKFLRDVGGVVTVDANGDLVSPIWSRTPPAEVRGFAQIIRDLDEYVRSSTIVEFVAVHGPNLGNPGEQPFLHLHAELPAKHPNIAKKYQTLGAKSAQVAEARQMIVNMVEELNIDQFKKYSALLHKTKSLDRLLPQAQWVEKTYEGVRGRWLQRLRKGERVPNAVNYAWRAAALAPLGYPNWGASLLKTGYDKFSTNGANATVKYLEFQLDPVRYQREQAPLTQSRLLTTASAFAKTGAESALTHRRCTINDIQELLWKPTGSYEEAATEGNHPAHKEIKNEGRITTAAFLTNVLPETKLAWLDADPSHMTTYLEVWSVCTDPDSVPILKWDSEEKRNMVACGQFIWGVAFSTMGFTQRYTPVVGAARHPAHWNGRQTHLYRGYSLFFEGLRPTYIPKGMLFKEYINERFREHAGVIERLSIQTELIDEFPASSLISLRLHDTKPTTAAVITMDAHGNFHRYYFTDEESKQDATNQDATKQ